MSFGTWVPDTPLSQMEDGTKVTHWWVDQAVSQDAYNMFVTRYTIINGASAQSEYLDVRGNWQITPPGAMIQPALTLSGPFMMAVTSDAFKRSEVAKFIQSIVDKVLKGEAVDEWH